MESRAGETPPEQLLEQTVRHCHELSVAKKESLELVELCTTLRDRLRDHSLTPQQPNYDDIKRTLITVEGQLAVWLCYSRPKRWLNRGVIGVGIRGFIGDLRSVAFGSSEIPPSTVNLPRNQGTNTPDPGGNPNRGPLLDSANKPPSVKRLDGQVTRLGEIPFAEGSYGEVYVGMWDKRSGEKAVEKVALKVLRSHKARGYEGKARRSLESKFLSWEELRHPNVLPFYGATEIGIRLYMVFPWQENGHLLDYVRKYPQSDKNYLLRDSTAGLNYLHLRGIVHGNVRCNNVLVTREGEPQICDFEIAGIMVTDDSDEATRSKTGSFVVTRYAAPELIEHNDFHATACSDTFSFAMLILECITEAQPFSNIPRDAAVFHVRIFKKQNPPRPDGEHRIPDDLWDLMGRCWSWEPNERPSMEDVYHFFEERA